MGAGLGRLPARVVEVVVVEVHGGGLWTAGLSRDPVDLMTFGLLGLRKQRFIERRAA